MHIFSVCVGSLVEDAASDDWQPDAADLADADNDGEASTDESSDHDASADEEEDDNGDNDDGSSPAKKRAKISTDGKKPSTLKTGRAPRK